MKTHIITTAIVSVLAISSTSALAQSSNLTSRGTRTAVESSTVTYPALTMQDLVLQNLSYQEQTPATNSRGYRPVREYSASYGNNKMLGNGKSRGTR